MQCRARPRESPQGFSPEITSVYPKKTPRPTGYAAISPGLRRDGASTDTVIPGRGAASNPESITTIGGYGFRARAEEGAPRNDGERVKKTGVKAAQETSGP